MEVQSSIENATKALDRRRSTRNSPMRSSADPGTVAPQEMLRSAYREGRGGTMTVTQVMPDLRVDDLDAARQFYIDSLGMVEESLGLEWITRFTDESTGTTLQVLTQDATAREQPAATVKVTDVDATYAIMQAAGYEIVHPLVTEEWGVRRFFVRPPGGAVLNIAQDHA